MDQFLKEQDKRYPNVTEGYVCDEQVAYLQNILKLNPKIRRVMEIGFNAGHSAATMLAARDDIHVTSFDIGIHSYVTTAKALVDELFPDRHDLILGDSMQTLPSEQGRFDFAFVDGGHAEPIPESDIRNAVRLLAPGDLIVVDDVSYPAVSQAYQNAIKDGLVCVHEGPTSTGNRSWVTLQRM